MKAVLPPSTRRSFSRKLALPIALATLLVSGPARLGADEDVVHRRRGIILRGKIVAYDSAGVRLRLDGNKETFIPVDEIDRVEVKLTAEQEQGESHLERREYAAAVEKFSTAFKRETRAWLRGQIAGKLVQAHMAAGDPAGAIDAFFTAAQTPDVQLALSAVPVWWLPDPPPDSVTAQAQSLLRSTNALHQVIGASYLAGSGQNQSARETLEKLVTFPDDRVAQLARTQLWRLDAATASASEVEGWQRQVLRLPTDVRGGPSFAIGLALRRLGRHDDAALAFLWPALVVRGDPRLAARALFNAAQSLDQAGRQDEARQLYLEVVQRFSPGSDAAAAEARLNTIKERSN